MSSTRLRTMWGGGCQLGQKVSPSKARPFQVAQIPFHDLLFSAPLIRCLQLSTRPFLVTACLWNPTRDNDQVRRIHHLRADELCVKEANLLKKYGITYSDTAVHLSTG